jgi:hypothetical protein
VFRACGGYESWAPLRAFPGRIPVPTGRERCGWAGPAAGKTSLPMAGRGGFLREAGSLGRERGQGKGGKKADLGGLRGGILEAVETWTSQGVGIFEAVGQSLQYEVTKRSE